MGLTPLTVIKTIQRKVTSIATPIIIALGGTGKTTRQEAIDALTDVSGATNEHVLTKDAGTGNAIFKSATGGVPAAHDLAGAEHNTDSLADLNAKISDGTVVDTGDARFSDSRTPTAHDLAGAEHNTDSLADLNAKISDGTVVDTGDARFSDSRTPTAHDLAGAEHNADTLADLNGKISDANLTNKFSKGGIIMNSDGIPNSALNIITWYAVTACTVTNVRGYRVGGTGATINAREGGDSNHLSSALSLASANTWTDGGAVQNTSYSAGDKLEIMIVSTAGTVTQIAIQVDFTVG